MQICLMSLQMTCDHAPQSSISCSLLPLETAFPVTSQSALPSAVRLLPLLSSPNWGGGIFLCPKGTDSDLAVKFSAQPNERKYATCKR
jgi:hypothetical protein